MLFERSKWPPQHAQARAAAAEAEVVVEGQRSDVVDLGVDHRVVGAALAHPREPVDHEGGAEARTTVARSHRQSLHVALAASEAADGVRDDASVTRYAEPGVRRRAQGIVEARFS